MAPLVILRTMATNNPLLYLLSNINNGEALKKFGEELQNGIALLGIKHEETHEPTVGHIVLRLQFVVDGVSHLPDNNKGVQLKVQLADLRVKEGPMEGVPPKPLMPMLN